MSQLREGGEKFLSWEERDNLGGWRDARLYFRKATEGPERL